MTEVMVSLSDQKTKEDLAEIFEKLVDFESKMIDIATHVEAIET